MTYAADRRLDYIGSLTMHRLPIVPQSKLPRGAQQAVAATLLEQLGKFAIDPVTKEAHGPSIVTRPVYVQGDDHTQALAWEEAAGVGTELESTDQRDDGRGVYLPVLNDDGESIHIWTFWGAGDDVDAGYRPLYVHAVRWRGDWHWSTHVHADAPRWHVTGQPDNTRRLDGIGGPDLISPIGDLPA